MDSNYPFFVRLEGTLRTCAVTDRRSPVSGQLGIYVANAIARKFEAKQRCKLVKRTEGLGVRDFDVIAQAPEEGRRAKANEHKEHAATTVRHRTCVAWRSCLDDARTL